MFTIKRFTKYLAYLLTALLLSCAVLEAGTVPVKAAGIDAPFTQLLDIALNKAGISANLTTLKLLEDVYLDNLADAYVEYKLYLENNGIADDIDAWSDFLTLFDWQEKGIKYLDFLVYLNLYEPDFVLNVGADTFTTLIREKLKTSFIQSDESDYVIPDSIVEGNKEVFDEMIDDYTGYYYVKTLSPSEVLASQFKTLTDYNNFCAYVNSSDNVTILDISTSGSVNDGTFSSYGSKRTFDNSVAPYFVKAYSVTATSALSYYDSNGELLNVNYYVCNSSGKEYWSVPYSDSTAFGEYSTKLANGIDNSAFYGYLEHSGSKFTWANIFLFTKDARKIKVYKSRDDLVNELAGTPLYHYYVNSTYDYSVNNDNSIKVSGDYLTDNSNTYSYETITNEIDNSQDNSYTNIDNSITNIVNNYGTSSGGSGDGSGDSGDSSGDSDTNIWDALTALISGIGDILEFIITAIAEVISLIGTFLTKIMDVLGSFQGISGDFFLFVGDFFPFIPQEIWDVILLGVTAAVGIAVWKLFQS